MSKTRFKLIAAVYLVLVRDGRILLLRRSNTGYEDGNYSMVAGHLEDNETLTQATIREARKEAGIDLRTDDLEIAHVMHRRTPGEDVRIEVFMRTRILQNELRNMEPDKCDDMGWFQMDDLPANVVPYIRQAIDRIGRNELYSEHGW